VTAPDRLVVFGYRGAGRAAEAAHRMLRSDRLRMVGRDAVAVLACDRDGRDSVTTYGQPLGVGPWSRFWSRVVAQPATIDPALHMRVRAHLVAGSSALCVVVSSAVALIVIDELGERDLLLVQSLPA
jgi:hypothetical protein